MIRSLAGPAVLLLVSLPCAALAQEASRSYAAFGYSQLETGQSTVGALTGRGGWKIRSWAGVEAEASIGVEDDAYDVSIGGSGGVIDLKHEVAAYAVAFLPIGHHVELFARAGGGTTRIEASSPAVAPLGSGESWNYGFGANLFYGANGVRADWTRKDFTGADGETDSWSVSYIRRF